MSFEKILRNPIRAAIVNSILSHEDASTVRQITQDMGVKREAIGPYLKVLMDEEILARAPHPTIVSKYTGKPVYVYYISPAHEELQDVLCALFPDKFDEVS